MGTHVIGAITSLLAKPRTLHADLEIDHLELTDDRVLLGLQVTWRNDILKPVELREVFLTLVEKNSKEASVQFTYLERFARIPYQKAITKIAGANSFLIQAGSTRTEHLRFMSREIQDLKEGKYVVELHSVVTDGTYLHTFNLKIAPQHIIGAGGKESAQRPTATLPVSVIARARRIAPM